MFSGLNRRKILWGINLRVGEKILRTLKALDLSKEGPWREAL